MVRTLADFDFKAQPSVNPDQVRDLEAGRWIAHAENLLLLGPPGVGKTHLAIGLGRAAAAADHSVLFVAAASLMVQLQQAHDTAIWEACLNRYVKPKLLVIDLCEAPIYVEFLVRTVDSGARFSFGTQHN